MGECLIGFKATLKELKEASLEGAPKDKKGDIVPAKDITRLQEAELEKLEEILEVMVEVHGSNRTAMNKEFREHLEKTVKDVRYVSKRKIEDALKHKRNVSAIIPTAPTAANFKQHRRKFLDSVEGNNSAESDQRSYINKMRTALDSELENLGVKDEFYSDEHQADLFLQFENAGKAETTGMAMVNVDNPIAVKIYSAIKKLNDTVYQDMQVAGLDINYRKDFLVSRNNDPLKLLGDGVDRVTAKATFVDDMLRNFVDDKTFNKSTMLDTKSKETGEVIITSESKKRKIVEDMFDSIIKPETEHIEADLQGRSSYLNSLRTRKLVIKPGMTGEYHVKYARESSLSQSIVGQMKSNARMIANTHNFGSRPKEYFDLIRNEFKNAYTGVVGQKELGTTLSKFERAWKETVAPPYSPIGNMQKAVNMFRGLMAFSKLGSTAFTAMYDTNSSALQLSAHTGMMQTKAAVLTIKKFTEVLASGGQTRDEMARLFNIMTTFHDPAILAGAHAGDFDTGFKIIDSVFSASSKLTGIPFQTALSKITNAALMTDAFQLMITRRNELNPFQLDSLKRWGIEPSDLDLISKHAVKNPLTQTVTPHDILDMPLDSFGAKSELGNLKRRDALWKKYSNWVDDAVHKGTPTPTAQVKRRLGKDRSINEAHRLAASLMFQFKETALKIAMSNKEAYDTHARVAGRTRANMAIAEYLMLGSGSYFAIESLKSQIFNTKGPVERLQDRDEGLAVFMDYLNRSGVVPLLTDAAETVADDSPWTTLADWAAGPAFSFTKEAQRVLDAKDKPHEFARFARRNLIPTSMWFYKALERNKLDYELLTGDRIKRR